ncbi:uncharacterized protein [Montipora foliosa]|uniref:uncharacterized protein n=1 Tax=Montipora foliosa TaxID=591990 RepID=UPI0035F10B2F
MYRPPNDLMSPLEKAWLKTSNIILLGDFNCDLKSISTTKRDPTAVKLLHIFDALNLQNIVQEPTRETPSSSTIIDLIVTTRKDLVSLVGTYPLGISDHNLIFSTIKLKNKRPPPKIICIRQYRNFDEKKFKEDIRAALFYIGSIFDDPDDQVWFWQQLYTDICDQHAPWKEIKVRASSAPWITNDIRLAMNRRYKLFKAAVTSKSAKLWSDYKRARNKVTSDVRRAKALYFSKMFNEVKSSSAYWKLVKDATSSRVHKPIGPLRKCDDSLVLTDKEKAGMMNSFFANIGKNIATKLPIPPGNATAGVYKSDLGDTSPPLLSQIEISPHRICRKINDLKSNKSSGPDNL